jgi:diguanylate cyclase (GGDEF)-like protein/PAS domain S-box-containing protein
MQIEQNDGGRLRGDTDGQSAVKRARLSLGLRGRSLVAMAIVGVLVLGAGIAGAFAVARGFDRAERETLAEHVDAAGKLVEQRAESIAASSRDYAFWTDTYEFTTGQYPGYSEESIGEPITTLESLGINALLIVDEDRELAYQALTVDGSLQDVPADLATWAAEAEIPELDTSVTAVTTIDGQPALASIAGVTDNDLTVDPVGNLIMARIIDDELLAELSAASSGRLSLGPPDAASELRYPDDDTAVGTVELQDLDGEATATLVATLERPVASAARDALRVLMLTLIVGLVLAFGGFGFWLTARVTKRIAALDRLVGRRRDGGEESVSISGDDEIARLSDNVEDVLNEVAVLQHRRAEARLGSMIQQSSDIVMLCDASGSVRYATPALQRTLGVDPATVADRFVADVLNIADRESLTANLARLKVTPPGQTQTLEYDAQTAGGEARHIEIVGLNHLGTPDLEALVLTVRDQTERRRYEEDLRNQAVTDALTGLANRTLFRDRVMHALLRQQRHPNAILAVLFLDLDDFKTINDSLGHDAGDAVLQRVAAALDGCLRSMDTAARLGGDEFACLIEDVTAPEEVTALIERIHAAVGEPIELSDDRVVTVEVSIGVAYGDGAASDAETLLRNADTAMYMAKAGGKGRHEVFEPEMHTVAMRRLELKSAMAEALARDEFRLVYQPIIDLETGRSIAAEALLRWKHPVWGEVGPLEFIPLAEETGFIVPLGRWVLDQACGQAVGWQQDSDAPISVSVNVSVRQLAEERIVDDVAQALADSGLSPELLQLELTESLFIQDQGAVAATLGELKHLGVRLAIDDFGTGHATLAYLRDFPIDVLKIDRSFVQAINDSDSRNEFIEGVLSLAHSLDMRTLAEGVETPRERDELRGSRCQLGQGYLFARPLEVDVIDGWLQEQRGQKLEADRTEAGSSKPSQP